MTKLAISHALAQSVKVSPTPLRPSFLGIYEGIVDISGC